jgi:hypothetical protein
VPRFVEEEFRAYLRCGWLAGGFARFRCAVCGGRGFDGPFQEPMIDDPC